MEFFWKKMSLLSVRLIWKTSLQMLSRLFPLTASCRENAKEKAHFNSIFRRPAAHVAQWQWQQQTPTHPHLHRKLTARQSSATRRLSRAESRSMRRNSVRSIPDLLAQLRPSMSASSRAPWRLSHKSHRRSTEASAEPDITAERLSLRERVLQSVKSIWKNSSMCECVCVGNFVPI